MNISILNKDKCNGCSACYNVCPHKAINMHPDSEGFLSPQINLSSCTKCHRCVSVCSVLNPKFKNKETPECYAAMGKDDVRAGKTSSGGFFPTLAKFIVNKGGEICGALLTPDMRVEHQIITNIEGIEKLKGSKYVQSNINDVYKKVSFSLKKNKTVLFSGVPCQVAGLKNFLGRDYRNLITVDILCHGVPSQKIFQKYLNEITENKEKIIDVNFRDKIKGWSHNLIITTRTANSTYSFSSEEDRFLSSFLDGVCLRKSCGQCVFAKIPRQGDITIGDFWGIEKYKKELNDSKGTSIVLINNSKGSVLFESIRDEFFKVEKVPLKFAFNGQGTLSHPTKHHHNRKLFFDLLDKRSLRDIKEICVDDVCDYLILNYWNSNNYGAMLTAFALQEIIKGMGFIPKLLNIIPYEFQEDEYPSVFARNYLDGTRRYQKQELKDLAKKVKRGVIVGSDQVFRYEYIANYLYEYLLMWCNQENKKIAISASFGVDEESFLKSISLNKKRKSFFYRALSSFDYLSSREISGVNILKNVFNLNGDLILDPVFLLKKEKYETLLVREETAFSNSIVSYVLDRNEKYESIYQQLERKYKVKVCKIENNVSVEKWLGMIKNCKLLITDSYHGCCFSMIFNKPFVCIKNKNRGETRFNSLIELFDLKENFVDSVNEIIEKENLFNINLFKTNIKLEEEKEKSLNLVKKVLEYNYTNNQYAHINKIKLDKSLNKTSWGAFFKYIRYSILSKITVGRTRERYKIKQNKFKELINYRNYK